jgi:hypothetical protein
LEEIKMNTTKQPHLTLKTAKAAAIKALGTAKGIAADPRIPNKYNVPLGKFVCDIGYDHYSRNLVEVTIKGAVGSTYSLYDPLTLDQDFEVEGQRERAEHREAIENWVLAAGPEDRKKRVDAIWDRGGKSGD